MTYTIKTSVACVVMIFFLLPAFAQNTATLYDELVYVNQQWKYQADADPAYKTTPSIPLSENELIQFHLQQTEKLLRSRNINHLSASLQKQRKANLDVLHAYWQRGVFPVNDKHLNRQPYFIDKYNTYCAVGYIMQQSGADDIARDIHNTQNFSYLLDINHPSLMKWVAASGLTLDELALIQPGYGGEWPSTITEMHYSNTGTDVNEYIEVHQSNGALTGMQTFRSVLLYTSSGTLYRTISISEMQGFYRNNSENKDSFYYYQFLPNEVFADSGKIEIRSGLGSILSYYTYNYSGITHVDNYVYWSTSPHFFPVTENETTPLDNSITFCGLYTSTWNASIQPATRGTLNACTKGALPITLSAFNYAVSNKTVQLKWETATEINNSYFEIEQSTDGINFQSIGKVKGAGNSNNIKSYSFNDNTPGYTNHYRLKQVDFDGNAFYSKILFVKVDNANPLALLQNIVTTNLKFKISLEQNNISSLVVYDFTGREALRLKGISGSNSINVSILASGKYLLRLFAKSGSVYNQQFVKQ